MLHHVWGVCSSYDTMHTGALVTFDYSNAFPSLTHQYIAAVLELIQLPASYMAFVLDVLSAPYHFCVGRGVVREVIFQPQAGIGQGDPFSPVLFSFCVSFILYPIERVERSVPYMYADDLCIVISGTRIVPIIQEICEIMNRFAIFSGLKINFSKCGIVVKGPLHPLDQQATEQTPSGEVLLGISLCPHVKYLGVRMGNITSDEAFSFPLAEAQRRASRLAALQFSLRERILLLKTWILPTVLLTARAYFPSDITIKALKGVFNTALGVDSWGVTLDQIAQLPELGGYQLPTPKVWLHAQFGTAFHAFLKDPNVFPASLVTRFTNWCHTFGVQLHAWALPYLQLGPIPYKTFDYLSFSVKSFSIARRYVLDGLADQSAIGQLPLWHSAVFKNESHLTYYSPKLISMSILTIADLFDEHMLPRADLLKHIGPTWQALYRQAPRNMLTVPVTDWSLPSVWTAAWAKSLTLKRLAANPHTETRCSPRVWQAF